MLPYRQAFPALLLSRIISALILQVWLLGFSALFHLLVRSTGRVAVTSGDFLFLFTTWQGILVIVLTLVTLFLYVAIDVNSLVILCSRLLYGEKPRVLYCIWQGFLSLRKFIGLRGLLIVLYLTLLSPIIGFGVSISLTENLYIPKFITSVIYSTPLYLIGFILVCVLLIALGFLFIFILHGALLDDMSLKEAGRGSSRMFKKNWKNFIVEMLKFLLILVLFILAILVVMGLILLIARLVSGSDNAVIPITVCCVSIVALTIIVLQLMFVPFVCVKVTQLYYRYKNDGDWTYEKRPNRKSPLVIVLAVFMVLVVALSTLLVSWYFDDLFPSKVTTGYIAHRAGGFEAPENTVAGLDAAYEYGAIAGEIDIQRTKDGYYVVNHDATFERTTGVDKKPSEMTLEEVKQLKVDGKEPVATFEEMLEGSRGRLLLLVELKGESADFQMAEDAVRIIKEKDMVDEAVLISLKYDLIDYIETNYPEMQTGYLAFASFGDTASLNCDYLALEEETATSAMINEIHDGGKKIWVWTVNDDEDIESFLRSRADAIITDAVKRSEEITEELEAQSPLDRIIDGVIRFFFG